MPAAAYTCGEGKGPIMRVGITVGVSLLFTYGRVLRRLRKLGVEGK